MGKDKKGILFFLIIAVGGLLFSSPQASAQQGITENIWTQRLYELSSPYLPKDRIKLFFIGDVMLHSAQIDRDYTPFLEDLKPRVQDADISVANMEFPLGGKPYTGYPSFSAPDSYADYIAGLGFDVFLTANNHIYDRGAAGLERTLKKYSSMESVRFTGAYGNCVADSLVNPLIIIEKGFKIAFVNLTYGTNYGTPSNESGTGICLLKEKEIDKLFSRAKNAGADYIIALPHWGEEYFLKHNRTQENQARLLAEAGADIIIGSHSHVIQDTCSVVTSSGKRVPVLYSLGNAVSNMSLINTRLELAATIVLERTFHSEVSLVSLELEFLWCTLPGMFIDNYRTVIVKDRIGHREDWKEPSDYDNMTSTLERVKKHTGIGK